MYLILVLLALDLITKQIFGNIKNYGAAFGALEGFNWFFVAIGAIVIWILLKYRKKVNKYGFYFLMAGVLGNLIDRVIFRYVRDFISINIWPSFNLADVFNVVGVILIIILPSIKKKKKN